MQSLNNHKFFLHMCATRAAVHPGGKSKTIFKRKMSLLHVLMCYHFRHGRRSLSMVRCLLAECRDTTEWPSYLWGTHHCRSDCRPAVQADIYRYIQIYTGHQAVFILHNRVMIKILCINIFFRVLYLRYTSIHLSLISNLILNIIINILCVCSSRQLIT